MVTEQQKIEARRDESIHTSMDKIDYNLGTRSTNKAYVPKNSVEAPGEEEFGDILKKLEKLIGFVPPNKK